MSRVFLTGATGGVGSRLRRLLVDDGHEVVGLHRSPHQAQELAADGVAPVAGDLIDMKAADLARAMDGNDVVVFSAGAAGSGMERTSAIDGGGVIKMIEACRICGVPRVLLVSVFMDAGRQRERREGFEHYIQTKRSADVALSSSGLRWVILRPGRLHDEAGDGKIRAGWAVPYGMTARDHVAAVLAKLVGMPEIDRQVIEMTDGDIPLEEALGPFRRG